MKKQSIIEEEECLTRFLKTSVGQQWCNKYKIIDKEKSEAPDYLFKTETGDLIGLEITKFIVNNDNTEFTQAVRTIGNKVYQYIKKKYDLTISIFINKKYNNQMLPARSYKNKGYKDKEGLGYNQGVFVINISSKNELKGKMQECLENSIELIRNGGFIEILAHIQEKCYEITVDGSALLYDKYECYVGDIGWCVKDPFNEIQTCIDKKNDKIENYYKKCDECFLLVVVSGAFKGNFYCFTNELREYMFNSRFTTTFLYEEEACVCHILNTK